jgi:hypothetical protein
VKICLIRVIRGLFLNLGMQMFGRKVLISISPLGFQTAAPRDPKSIVA